MTSRTRSTVYPFIGGTAVVGVVVLVLGIADPDISDIAGVLLGFGAWFLGYLAAAVIAEAVNDRIAARERAARRAEWLRPMERDENWQMFNKVVIVEGEEELVGEPEDRLNPVLRAELNLLDSDDEFAAQHEMVRRAENGESVGLALAYLACGEELRATQSARWKLTTRVVQLEEQLAAASPLGAQVEPPADS